MHRMKNARNIKQELQIVSTSTSGEDLVQICLIELKYHMTKECPVNIKGKTYSFDFSIWNNGRLEGFIEYDGEQHFYPVVIFGGEEGFKKTKENDSIKNAFCKEQGLKLLRIAYDDPKGNAFYKDRIKAVFPESIKANIPKLPDYIGTKGAGARNKKSSKVGNKKSKIDTKAEHLSINEFTDRFGIDMTVDDFDRILATRIQTLSKHANTKFKKIVLGRKRKNADVHEIRVHLTKQHILYISYHIPKEKLREIRVAQQRENEMRKREQNQIKHVEIDETKALLNTPKVNNGKSQRIKKKRQTLPVTISKTDKETFISIIDDIKSDRFIICRTGIKVPISYFQASVVNANLEEIEKIYYEYEIRAMYKPAYYGIRDYIKEKDLKDTSLTLISSGAFGLKGYLPDNDKHDLAALAETLKDANIRLKHVIAPAMKIEIKNSFRKTKIVSQTQKEITSLPFDMIEINDTQQNVKSFVENKKDEAIILIKSGYNTDKKLGFYDALLVVSDKYYTHKVVDKIGQTVNLGILLATKYLLHSHKLEGKKVYMVHNTDLGFNLWKKKAGTHLMVVDDLISYVVDNNIDFIPVRYKGKGVSDEVNDLIKSMS